MSKDKSLLDQLFTTIMNNPQNRQAAEDGLQTWDSLFRAPIREAYSQSPVVQGFISENYQTLDQQLRKEKRSVIEVMNESQDHISD
jgi:hypothetical protein